MDDWAPLGPVVQAQIQTRPLKEGERPWRIYHPEHIVQVDRVILDAPGVTAVVDGAPTLDVHHSDHPQTRHRPGRALSIGFTSHYLMVADHFGSVEMGCGAETLIVDTDEVLPLEAGSAGFLIATADGHVTFPEAGPAQPCAPFTRYLLGRPTASEEEVAPHRATLRDGVRGFVMDTAHLTSPIAVAVGDVVYRRAA